ncbi:MAG: hypothetical protein CVV44_09570 [Spirochaetae bacterium HGW-Spirochaetae-1]|jgi:O-6-methylguanine DNA methyltransferase|nr:MAG: hypothetical protein CVV44_09570 [Spirochaetae bacterium HGW-Spirochaetae-1]
MMKKSKISHSLDRLVDLRTRTIDTPLCPVSFIADSRALRAVILNPAGTAAGESTGTGRNPIIANAGKIINLYFSKRKMGPVLVHLFSGKAIFFSARTFMSPRTDEKLPAMEITLDLSFVSEGERSVYQRLLEVPCGYTVTYGELAMVSGYPGGARFVGNAMAKNPFPLFIPCHRVIRAGGDPGEFTSGRERKLFLLHMEGAL